MSAEFVALVASPHHNSFIEDLEEEDPVNLVKLMNGRWTTKFSDAELAQWHSFSLRLH
jgi:hypothetical protein